MDRIINPPQDVLWRLTFQEPTNGDPIQRDSSAMEELVYGSLKVPVAASKGPQLKSNVITALQQDPKAIIIEGELELDDLARAIQRGWSAMEKLANDNLKVPVAASKGPQLKSNVITALQQDLKAIIEGELELDDLARAFERVVDLYEGTLEATLEYHERESKAGLPSDPNEYQGVVKLWMSISDTVYDRVGFELWAPSVVEGYRLDIQISDTSTAETNLRREIENYLW